MPTKQKVLETYEKVKHLEVKDGFLETASGYSFYNTSPFTFESLIADSEHIEKGNILNTSSVSGVRIDINGYAYCASKSGLINMSKVIAKDFAAKGVRVNIIAPGITDTPMLADGDKEGLEHARQLVPMQRLGSPEELAKGALFLVSDDASYITGNVLFVDGGLSII